jgi:predicted secreted protein
MAEIQIGVSDTKRQFKVSVGDYLVVALLESPSTGQSWFAQTSNALIIRSEGEAFEQTGALTPGGAGTRQFRFIAVSQGEAKLFFSLAFAASEVSMETLTLSVTVS